MALSVNIDLCAPFVILSSSASLQSVIIPAAAVHLKFGTVQQTHRNCDVVSVGSSVLFDVKDAIEFMVSTTPYYMIDSSKIFFIEELPS